MKYYKNKETGEVLEKDSFEEIDGFLSADGYVMSYDDEAWVVSIYHESVVCKYYENTKYSQFANIFKDKISAINFAEDLKEQIYKKGVEIIE